MFKILSGSNPLFIICFIAGFISSSVIFCILLLLLNFDIMIIFLILCVILQFLFYMGYLDKIKSFLFVPKKELLAIILLRLGEIISKQNETGSSFSINDGSQSASMIYMRFNQKHILNIPYKRNLLGKMSKFSVFLLKSKEDKTEEIDITQQPGVIYFCTASQLGGYKIIIRSNETNDNIAEFKSDEIPSFDNI